MRKMGVLASGLGALALTLTAAPILINRCATSESTTVPHDVAISQSRRKAGYSMPEDNASSDAELDGLLGKFARKLKLTGSSSNRGTAGNQSSHDYAEDSESPSSAYSGGPPPTPEYSARESPASSRRSSPSQSPERSGAVSPLSYPVSYTASPPEYELYRNYQGRFYGSPGTSSPACANLDSPPAQGVYYPAVSTAGVRPRRYSTSPSTVSERDSYGPYDTRAARQDDGWIVDQGAHLVDSERFRLDYNSD